MSKSVYVRVVHDLELLCSSLCDRTTALISHWINKVYCYCILLLLNIHAHADGSRKTLNFQTRHVL